MKYSEVIKALEENPKKVFECNLVWRTAKIYARHGWYQLEFYNTEGEKIPENMSGGAFSGNIHINYEWQEMKQPVTWQEAFEEWLNGRTVFCFLENGKKVEYDQNINFIHAHSLKTGTWYIED